MAENGQNWPGFVPFWPLVLNMTGFDDDDDDDDDEYNGMAYILVLTVTCLPSTPTFTHQLLSPMPLFSLLSVPLPSTSPTLHSTNCHSLLIVRVTALTYQARQTLQDLETIMNITVKIVRRVLEPSCLAVKSIFYTVNIMRAPNIWISFGRCLFL